ncbi:MAG: Gldg family protein [Pseudomonadota bacterium]
MKKHSGFLGLAGAVLVAAGALVYAIYPFYLGFYLIPLVLGGLLILSWAALNFDRLRVFGTSRSARYGAGSLLASALALGVLVFLALLTVKHSTRLDLTENQTHSLAPQTLKVLAALKTEVKAVGYFQLETPQDGQARDLLQRYAHASDKFKFEMVDPDRNPARAKAAGVTRYETVVVESSGGSEQLQFLSEDRLTNAVLRVTRSTKKTIYFLTGHGEKDLVGIEKDGFSDAKTSLANQNYEVKHLLLMNAKKVPDDAAVVVLAGPQKDLFDVELESLGEFLRAGGKVLFLIDPQTEPGLAAWLKKYNVQLGDDIIVDKMSRLFGGDYLMPLVSSYTQHPLTRNFSAASFFPLARSVSVTEEKQAGVAVVPLAETGEEAWGETDLNTLAEGTARFLENEDRKGPVALAVVGTVDLPGTEDEAKKTPTPDDLGKRDKKGKFIVFGDSDFASNAYFNQSGNGDLFLASVGWLAEEEDLVAVRAKEPSNQPLMLSAVQIRLLFWLPVVVLPLLILVIGAAVLFRRSRK